MDVKSRKSGANLDFERFRLRSFIESLPAGELDRIAPPVDLADIAAALEGNPRAVLFDSVGAEGALLAGNVCASRARLAIAFATEPARLTREIMNRMGIRQDVVEVPRELAPVQAIVQKGEAADLTALPVHLQHGLDGAPYISASIDFSLDGERNWTNVGMRRLMLRGCREAGVDLNAPSDLRAMYLSQVKRGAPLAVAFVVGSHPIDHLSATMRVPGDELDLMASLRGTTLPVVKCVTSDIRVPADAEFVLEGEIDSRGFTESEGPYGEFLGYYGEVKRNPVFHLTAITRRADAMFQTSTIGGRMLACTDTAQLIAVRTEATLWHALQTAVREVTAVHATPQSGGAFNVRIALRQRVPGEARNAIAAAFGCHANVKNVFVVDPDIDVFSDAQMDWALATRFQADRDLVVESGFRAMPLDPSLQGSSTWAKAGFDLTVPLRENGGLPPIAQRVPEPPAYRGKRFPGIAAALAEGPKYFEELMAATGSRDGREIVRELERLRAGRGLERDAEGRYRFK